MKALFKKQKLKFFTILALVMGAAILLPHIVYARTFQAAEIKIKITTYKEYRIVKGDKVHITYNLLWDGQGPAPVVGTDGVTTGLITPTFAGFYAGLNEPGKKLDCGQVLFQANSCDGDLIPGGYGGHTLAPSLPYSTSIDVDWTKFIEPEYTTKANQNVPSGQAQFSKDFVIFPIVVFHEVAGIYDYYALTESTGVVPITVKVYADQASRDASFKADNLQQDPTNPQVSGGANNQQDTGGTGTSSKIFAPSVGDPFLSLISGIVVAIAGTIRYIMVTAYNFFILPTIVIMLSIHTYTDGFVRLIYPQWQLLRNLSNIFFIISLLVIGLASIFQVSSYNYRNLIPKLIIAALLVNFSLIIPQAILGVAETVQNQFLPGNVNAVRAIGDILIMHNSFYSLTEQAVSNVLTVLDGFKAWLSSNNEQLVQRGALSIIDLAFAIGGFLTLAAVAIYLLIRIVMILVLLMLSPLAFVCGVLPVTAKYQKMWWDYFLRYAFFAPIMALFLNLAAYTALQQANILRLIKDPLILQIPKDASVEPLVINLTLTLAVYMLTMVFLIAGIRVAKAMGIAGSQGITNFIENGMRLSYRAPLGLGKTVLKGAGVAVKAGGSAVHLAASNKLAETAMTDNGTKGGLAKIGLLALNPKKSTASVLEQFKKKKSYQEAGINAALGDTTSRANPFVKETHQYEDTVIPQRIKEAQEAMQNYTAAQIHEEMQHPTSDIKLAAAISMSREKGYLDDFLKDNDLQDNREGLHDYINKQVAAGVLSEATAAKVGLAIDAHSDKDKNYKYAGLANTLDAAGRRALIGDYIDPNTKANVYTQELRKSGAGSLRQAENDAVTVARTAATAAGRTFTDADFKRAKGEGKKGWENNLKLSNPEYYALYKNGEALSTAQEYEAYAARKMAPSTFASDMKASALVSSDGGELDAEAALVEHFRSANDQDYAQKDKVDAGHKQAVHELLISPAGRGNLRSRLSDSLIAEAKNNKVALSVPDANAQADKRIKEVAEKYYGFNTTTNTPIISSDKDHSEVRKKTDANWRQALDVGVDNHKDRLEVQKHVNNMVNDPKTFTYGLPTKIASKIDSAHHPNISNGALDIVANNLTQRFDPKYLSFHDPIDSGELNNLQQHVQLAIRSSAAAQPTRSLADLRPTIFTEIESKFAASTNAEVRASATLFANKILADI